MLWNKAKRSENVNDQRKDKDVRSSTGNILAAGLVASVLGVSATFWADIEKAFGPEAAVAAKVQTEATIQLQLQIHDDPHRFFVESILGSSEEVWTELFAQLGKQYQPPALVLFDEKVATGCGPQRPNEMGLFYCPEDKTIYINLETLGEVAVQSSTVSDFAQAYAIIHEVGHHIQNETGVLTRLEQAQAQGQKYPGADGLSVRLELQADCLAGVWARHAQERFKWLEPGDIDEALTAASMAGDDYLMRKANSTVNPKEFAHGTSEQRIKWFNTGFNDAEGDCRTFDGAQL